MSRGRGNYLDYCKVVDFVAEQDGVGAWNRDFTALPDVVFESFCKAVPRGSREFQGSHQTDDEVTWLIFMPVNDLPVETFFYIQLNESEQLLEVVAPPTNTDRREWEIMIKCTERTPDGV